MSLSAECGHCFRAYHNIPDSAAGKAFRCKDCGQLVLVEAGGVASPPPMAAPMARPTGRPKPRTQAKTSSESASSPIALLSCLAVVALAAGGGYVYVASHEEAVAERPVETIGELHEELAETSEDVVEIEQPSDAEVMLARAERRVNEKGASPFTQLSNGLDDGQPAYVEGLLSHERSKLLAPLVANMTPEEFDELNKIMPSLLPMQFQAAVMLVPYCYELDDDAYLEKRQQLTAKLLKKRKGIAPLAGPMERMSLEQYREFERSIGSQEAFLKAVRNALTRGPFAIPKLKPEEITYNDQTGLEFPERLRERLHLAAREAMRVELARTTNQLAKIEAGESLDVVPDDLPFWVPLDIQPAEEIDWAISWTGSPKLPGEGDDYITSVTPSPFIAGGLTGFNNGQLRVFDVRTGEKVGELAVPVENGDLHLSPDGKRVVLEKTMPGIGKDYLVYSFESGELERTITAPDTWVVSWAAYVTSERFVTFEAPEKTSAEPRMVCVYDVTSGEKVVTFPYEDVTHDDFMAVSDDGRYLARLSHSNELDLFDLENGRMLATKPFDRDSYSFKSLDFSPDGKRIAILSADSYEATELMILDCDSGAITKRFVLGGDFSQYEPGHASYAGRDLEWFPDGTALWVGGAAVIDVERECELLRYTIDPKDLAKGYGGIPTALRIPMPDGVIVIDNKDGNKVLHMPVDFIALRELADADIDDTAVVPDDPVAIEIAFQGVEMPEGAEDVLRDTLAEVLESRGFEVVDGDEAEAVFQLRPGRGVKSDRRSSSLSKDWEFLISWVPKDGGKPLWSDSVIIDLMFVAKQAGTDDPQKIVEKLAGNLKFQIMSRPIPRTVSKDGKIVLPATEQAESKKASSSRRRRSR